MLRNIWRKLFCQRNLPGMRKQARSSKTRQTFRRWQLPSVEPLEDRTLLSTVLNQFAIPTAQSSPYGIALGPDGNLWFTEFKGNNIGEINPTTDAVTEYPIPTSGSLPFGITAGPDGNLWFTETSANQIGMINPATGTISEFPVPTAGSLPFAITAGPDGNLWFTESNANQIGVINPSSHAINEYTIPTANSGPGGIAAGPDGNLWFTENSSSQIARINPSTGAITEYPTPTASSGPLAIVADSGGDLWFTENNVDQVGAISQTTGAISEYVLPSATSIPFWIAAGPNGNLWFTEMSSNQIGEINLDTGNMMQLSSGGSPTGITPGPDGTLWFGEAAANKIGELILPPGVTASPTSQVIDAGQSASFTAVPGSVATATVQWQVSANGGQTFTPLSDDAIYAGVTSEQLTIFGAPAALNGDEYRAVFANSLDANVTSITAAATLTVRPALSLPSSIPQGTAGTNYKHTFTVSGGVRPLSTLIVTNFSDNGTGLTAGAITARSGTITVNGLPSAPGTASFTVNATDATGAGLTRDFTITINAPPTLGALSATQWTAGKSGFAGTSTISGGTQPFTLISYSGLPTGLTPTVNGATVSFQGAPSVAKIFGAGSITVEDAAGEKVTRTFSITINPALTIGTLTMDQWTAGTSGYSGSMSVSGGTGPVTITHAGGVPTGLTAVLSGGAISFTGVASVARTFNASITIQDAVGASLTKTFTITIHTGATIGSLTLSQWTIGKPGFTGAIKISGGTGPFSITASKDLPTGLTPVVRGSTISFTGVPTATATLALAGITIQDGAGATVSTTFAMTINPPPGLGDLTVNQWTAGKQGFNGTMQISGGTEPFLITAASGFPTGLTATVSGSTISFTGTPLVAGTFAAGSLTIRDAAGASVTKTFSITMNPRLTVGGMTRSLWTINQSGFPGSMSITGGTGSFSITHTGGVPHGLTATLTGGTITFTGAPSVAGTFTGSLTVQDTVGASITKTFTLTISNPISVGTLTVTKWTRGKSGFSGIMTITGGTGPFQLELAQNLPIGLSANVSGRTISFSGIPSVAGLYPSAFLTVEDSTGATVMRSFSISINP